MGIDTRSLGLLDDAAIALAKGSGVMSPGPGVKTAAVQVRRKGSRPGVSADDLDGLKPLDDVVHTGDSLINKALLWALPIQLGLVGMLGGGLEKVNGWLGNSSAVNKVAGGLKGANEVTFSQAGKALGIAKPVGAVSQMAMNGLASVAGGLQSLGVTDAMANRWGGKLNAHMAKLEPHAGALFSANVTHSGLKDVLGQIQNAHALGPKAWDEGFDKLVGKARELAAEHHPAISKSLKKYGALAEKAHLAHYMEEGWRHAPQNLRGGVGAISKTQVTHGMMNAAFVTGAMASDYFTGRDLQKTLKSLRAFVGDITNRKAEDVPWMEVLVGKLPEPAADARWQIVRSFGPSMVLDAANTVVNVRSALHTKFNGMSQMFWFMALPMGSQMWRSSMGSPLLPNYIEAKDAEARGEAPNAKTIALLVGESVKDLRARGGAESNFAKALGEHYAEQKLSVSQVVQRAANGQAMKDLEYLKNQYKKHVDQQSDVHAKMHQEHAPQAEKKAIPSALAPKQHENLGKYTRKYNNEIAAAGHELSK